MEESGEYRQVLEEISAEQSKHDAKLRSDELDRSLMQDWYNELEKIIKLVESKRTQINSMFRINLKKILFKTNQNHKKTFLMIMTLQALIFSLSKQ